jgi:hypothetical protein
MAIYFEGRKKGIAILSATSNNAFMYIRDGKLVITQLQDGRHNTLEIEPEEIEILKRLTSYSKRRDVK